MSDNNSKKKFGVEFGVYDGKTIESVGNDDWCSSLKKILSEYISKSEDSKISAFVPNSAAHSIGPKNIPEAENTSARQGSTEIEDSKDKISTANLSKEPTLKIVFCKMEYLHDDDLFKYIVEYHKHEGILRFSPILLISTDQLNYQKIIDEKDKEIVKNLNLEKRKLYWDSSIWNRYLYLNDGNFKTKFENVLKDFTDYFDKDLYSAYVCQEFIEFQTRMMSNSYLEKFGENSHRSQVIPFKFHSEKNMEEDITDQLKKQIKNYKWRILIVDDYADICLKQDNYGNKLSRKWKIICKLLNRDLTSKCRNKDCLSCRYINMNDDEMSKEQKELTFRFYTPIAGCSETKCDKQGWSKQENLVQESFKALKNIEITYDIILIDYLLGLNEDSTEREFSSELINKIAQDYNSEENRYNNIHTPFGKAYLFPISAFSNALLDDLREQGISHHSEKWELASGADPINSPKLFMYKFAKFLSVQINDSRRSDFKELSYDTIIRYYPVFQKYSGDSLFINLTESKKEQLPKILSDNLLRAHFLRLLRFNEYNENNNDEFIEAKVLFNKVLKVKEIDCDIDNLIYSDKQSKEQR
ncbi:hypothetical protein JEZ13_02050 [bacterium]|nr:hypothetical protein [bacterium]